MTTARRLAPAAATSVLVAIALDLIYGPWFLNYDARYALLWAQDLANGHAPEYTADFAPTPHPLQTAFGLLALPFGAASDDVLVFATLLAFGALVYLAFALGRELYSPWVGLVAALVVLTRPAMERDALLAYQDVPFAALVVGAVLAEARKPRRGTLVLVLLAVAGLLRPEAWVLSGLYVLWIWRDRDTAGRAAAIAIAAAAPLIWAASDWAVTGDPLHSLHGTADLAEAVDRRRDIVDAPYWTAQYYGYSLREPLVIGIPVGLFFAWRFRRREAILPLVVVAAMTLVFMIGPAFGLPLIGRYVRTPSVLLTLFYGLAVCGFLTLNDPRARRLWMWIGIACAGLSIVFLPWHVGMLADLERRIDRDGAMYAALRDTAHDPAVRRAVEECGGRITATDYRPLPHLRWWLGTDPGSVGTTLAGASPRADVMLLPRRVPLMRRFYQENFPRQAAPPGWQEIYRNGLWRVVAAPDCVTRLRA